MHQVGRHVEAAAVDLFLGRAAEVDLLQGVGLAGQGEGVVAEEDIDRAAAINDAEAGRLVAETNRLDVDLDAVADVDRRLALAGSAQRIARIELGPVLRRAGALLAPVDGRLRLPRCVGH